MGDLATMLWKESAELVGNRRSLRVYAMAVLLMGLLPVLTRPPAMPPAILALMLLGYTVFSSVVVAAQAAPDLVLRERAGRTLETLLASRLSDAAIFGGKVAMAAALGWSAALLTAGVQLVALNLRSGGAPWQWSYLALAQGRVALLVGVPLLGIYLGTVGSFVATRVGDQRPAYTVTMLSVGLLALPVLLHLVSFRLTPAGVGEAVGALAVVDLLLLALAVRFFRRSQLILHLQD